MDPALASRAGLEMDGKPKKMFPPPPPLFPLPCFLSLGLCSLSPALSLAPQHCAPVSS
eukprot:COSAG02_NODE_2560_length_8525_cov_89.485348_1_plen_57_part_10